MSVRILLTRASEPRIFNPFSRGDQSPPLHVDFMITWSTLRGSSPQGTARSAPTARMVRVAADLKKPEMA
jgi:hypothetical protein